MYLSEPGNFKLALQYTGLSEDELLSLVGRFKPDHHSWPGQPRGQLIVSWDGNVRIVHHYTKQTLFKTESEHIYV
jgi:hypothetical protein